jgi:large subunit ribosomal protein L31
MAKSMLKKNKMKKDLHPKNYRMVVFKDMSNGTTFLSKSTAVTSETIVFEEDGKEYPVIKLEISNTSHPFYTGKNVLVDTAGRIDKFNKRFGKKTPVSGAAAVEVEAVAE